MTDHCKVADKNIIHNIKGKFEFASDKKSHMDCHSQQLMINSKGGNTAKALEAWLREFYDTLLQSFGQWYLEEYLMSKFTCKNIHKVRKIMRSKLGGEMADETKQIANYGQTNVILLLDPVASTIFI